MKYLWDIRPSWWQLLYRLLCLLTLVIVSLSACAAMAAHAADGPAWAAPPAMTIRRVGVTASQQHEPTFLTNLDCTALTYRLAGTSAMRSGCFTPTAFGLLDSGNSVVIFNGTDEAVSLTPYSAGQVLVPWPRAGNMLTADALDTGGSLISMYKNPLASLGNQPGGGKRLVAPPETVLTDELGRRLVVNPQTMSFSDSGNWLVAATIYGAFVRINLASQEVLPFAPAFNNLNGSMPQAAQTAISHDGRYVAIESNQETSFKIYDLAACAASGTTWQTNACPSYEYWPFVSQQLGGRQALGHVRFINETLIGFETPPSDPAGASLYELTPAASLGTLTDYIGLGDSYTAGEGAFDYVSGADTATNHCHLSIHSYPLLLARDLFGAGGHSAACSGAVIRDVTSTSGGYRGQVEQGASLDELERNSPEQLAAAMAGYLPGMVAQHRFIQHYQPGVVTVSIGGNDIGFGAILERCVAPHVSLSPSGQTCYSNYEDRLELVRLIDRTVPRWTALFRQLQAEAPASRLYAIGYPSVAAPDGQCGLNVHLNRDELRLADAVVAYLNGAIQQAATAAQVPYVDISQALAGHRLCEANGTAMAMNGLTAGTDALGILGHESYHPNTLGQQLIEQAILRQTDNLRSGLSGDDSGDPNQVLLDAPKSGRPIYSLVPVNNLVPPVLRLAVSYQIHVDGAQEGLPANTVYTVRLDGPSGTVLATMTSDMNGDLAGSMTVPPSAAVGGHQLDILGSNQVGENLDITQQVYISGTVGDTDGDGRSDSSDSCPMVINSGQDDDQDRVDDACDPVIGGAPSSRFTIRLSARVLHEH